MTTGDGKLTLKSCYDDVGSIESIYTGGRVVQSHDEKLLCTACNEDIVVIETATGKKLAQLEGDTEVVTTFAIKPDGKHLVAASRSTQISIWDMSTYKVTRSFRAHDAPVIAMDIDMTSTLVATGSADSTVKVWDIDGGYCTHSFKGHGGVVSVAKFHPNMKHPRLATGGDDGTIRIWNLNTRKCESVLEGHVSIVRGLDFTADGRHLVSAGRDSVIHIWDIKARRIVRTIPAYESLESVGLLAPGTGFDKDAYDAAGKRAYGKLVVYSGGENGVIRLWDFDTGKELLRQNKEVNAKHACFDIIYARNSQQLLMVTSDQNILFYDVTRQLTKVRQIAGYNEEITDLRYIGPGNRHLIVATNAEYLKLYNLENQNCELIYGHGEIVLSLDAHCPATAITDSSACSLFASGSKDNTARVWLVDWAAADPARRVVCVAEAVGHTEAVGAVRLARKPGCNFMITGSQDRTVKLWDLSGVPKTSAAARQLAAPIRLSARYTFKAHDKDINSLAIAPNDQVFATGSQDKTAKLWSVAEGKLLGTFQGHRRGVWSVTFSPVDQVLATTSGDKTIKLWSLSDFSCLKTLEDHTSSVLSASFVTAGMQLVSVGGDGLVKLWTIKNEECVLTLDKHEDKIWSLAVADDGAQLATGGADSSIVFWKDTTEENIEKLHREQADELLKEQALSNYLQAKEYRQAITLALSLDKPHRLYTIFSDLLNARLSAGRNSGDGEADNTRLACGEDTGVLGLEEVDKVVQSLAQDQLARLLGYVRSWNTNAKLCHVSQTVLYCILSSYSPDSLLEIPEAKSIISALLSYSERHFNRMDRLLTDSYIIDYTLCAMDSLNLTDGVQGEAWQEEEDEADAMQVEASTAAASY